MRQRCRGATALVDLWPSNACVRAVPRHHLVLGPVVHFCTRDLAARCLVGAGVCCVCCVMLRELLWRMSMVCVRELYSAVMACVAWPIDFQSTRGGGLEGGKIDVDKFGSPPSYQLFPST